jgi:hypothetical protein
MMRLQAAVMLRDYKIGEYLAPYMSSLEAEERVSFAPRWGATLFAGVQACTARATPRPPAGTSIRPGAAAFTSSSSPRSEC